MADMVELLEKTELYRLFKKKAGDDDALRAAVKELCGAGEALSSQAYTFFPTFTRHDASHILGVCDRMHKLLKSMKKGKTSALDALTAEEAALLLLAACWHDSGMAVSEEQKKKLLAGMEKCLSVPMEKRRGDWKTYFQKHPGDEVALAEAKREAEKSRERERVLRNFVRERHAARCKEQLPDETKWKRALEVRGIYRETVEAVCASHGEWMEDLKLDNDNDEFDLRLCAVLLRLADLLDYDASRAPEELFRFLGLDHPETKEQRVSREEWNKNKTGGFRYIKDGKIYYRATFSDSQTEHGVKRYLDWLRHELDACQSYLEKSELDRWRGFELPHQVKDTSKCKGYEEGEFRITMDQDRLVELLSGSALYENAGVFVRELLQNSIDAVLERRKQDTSFGTDAGRIVVRFWRDDEGYGWFRIEDDGVGMDERIIKDYFLRVGHSYYDSDEYRAASLHAARQTGDKPTSRFGIGILSVFMSDPDNTVLQVLTRRYGEDETPLRLDVAGLHGYYNLTRITEERQGKPMEEPPYARLTETVTERGGTVVCARVNLFRLGETSIRELMDQYVVFPEVRVTFYDETGEKKDYPTQKELMDAVHKLEGKELICPLTPEMVERVKEKTRDELQWTEPPALMLRLHPLDTLPDTEEARIVSSVVLEVGFRGNAKYTKPVVWNGVAYESTVTLKARAGFYQEFRLNIGVVLGDGEKERLWRQFDALFVNDEWWKSEVANYSVGLSFCGYRFNDRAERMRWYEISGISTEAAEQFLFDNASLFEDFKRLKDGLLERSVAFSRGEVFELLSNQAREEWKILRDVLDVLQAVPKLLDVTAFNGAAAAREDLMVKSESCLAAVLLLRGEGRPAVNVARNEVTELSLDARCALSLLRKEKPNLFEWGGNWEQCALYTERAWFDLLKRHPIWETLLRCKDKTLEELEELVRQTGNYEISEYRVFGYIAADRLLFAALKKRFQISVVKDKLLLRSRLGAAVPSEFPLSLFVTFEEADGACALFRIRISGINFYSETHPFSQWLIAHQAELRDKTPAIYHDILNAMVLGDDADEIRDALNGALNRLARLSGKQFDFGVTEDLYLTERDFH